MSPAPILLNRRIISGSEKGVVTPPPSGLVYPPPTLTNPIFLTPGPGNGAINLTQGRDYDIDMGWIQRTSSILFYGWAGQKVIIRNYWAYISSAPGGSAYGRGGPRIRSSDTNGPAEVYIDGMLCEGPTIADNVAIDAGLNTWLTIANSRLQCSRDTTGVQFVDSTEHIDQVQTQGRVKKLRLCNCTLHMSDQSNPTDAGGKGMMLNKEGFPAFSVDLQYVNFYAVGRTGAAIFQDTNDIIINVGPGVYVNASGAQAGYTWGNGGTSLFFPNSWTSSGSAPNRMASFGVGWSGNIFEGNPPGGDYVSRADLGF